MLDLPARSESRADAQAISVALSKHASATGLALPLQSFGLAARVLAVTIGFVFLAMGLFYVSRLTAHREMWLHNKISGVQTTVEAFGLASPAPQPPDLSQKILNSVDVKWLAVETHSGRREFVIAGGPPTMFYCGNDAEAKAEVARVLVAFGWEPEDVGMVESARPLEALCQLWCAPGFLRGQWTHAYKLLKL